LESEVLAGIVFIKAQERQSHVQHAEGKNTDTVKLPSN
jgi:hypothetical protein